MADEQKKIAQIFISYASEDAPIATAFETAFITLSGDYQLDVIRDIHSFQQGRSLTGQIHELLEASDILFVIYTERLKKSYSFTGLELGSFGRLIYEDTRSGRPSDRVSVSLFFDDPPQPEEGVLGIKLDTDALDKSGAPIEPSMLDPDRGMEKFLYRLSDLMIEKQYRAIYPNGTTGQVQEKLDEAKKSKKKAISDSILPKLECDLIDALSAIIARNFIEQKLLEFRWEPRAEGQIEKVYDDTVLYAPNQEVYGIFGVPEFRGRVTWQKFCEALNKKDKKNGHFLSEAIQNAVSSAFADSPVDNDQVFLSASNKPYRVIVTRYAIYFNGGRTMHLYFIPFLSGRSPTPTELAITSLRLATEFRSDFLERDSPFNVSQFEVYGHDPSRYRRLVMEAVRQLQLTVAASHNAGLDEPAIFERVFGREGGLTPQDISRMYSDWENETSKILAFASASDRDGTKFMSDWQRALADYIRFVAPVNMRFGLHTAKRLARWFESGDPDSSHPRDVPSAARNNAKSTTAGRSRRSPAVKAARSRSSASKKPA